MHKTLKMTLAMAADVPMTLWSMDDLCEKMDTVAPKSGKRRPYKSECRVMAALRHKALINST